MPAPKPSVVFFGTGPVAAKSLELLLANFDVEAVVTKPKPEHHRGESPVLDAARRHGLTVISVTDKASVTTAVNNAHFTSKLAILIDFGIIVAEDVIKAFPMGIVNSHFSLLPRWRGADPITFAILNGDTKTGVSLMLVDAGMDTGKIIGQKTLHIESDETTPVLTTRLIELSGEMLAEYVPRYLSGEITPRKQPHPDRVTYSRRLTKEDGIISWDKPAIEIEREVRAFSGWPKSRTRLASKDVVILKASVDLGRNGKAGTVFTDGKQLGVYTAEGALLLQVLQPAGKNPMSAEAFLAGYGKAL